MVLPTPPTHKVLISISLINLIVISVISFLMTEYNPIVNVNCTGEHLSGFIVLLLWLNHGCAVTGGRM